MRLPRFRLRTLMIAVAVGVGLLPSLRTLAADYPRKTPIAAVVYANLSTQAAADRCFRPVGFVCSVVYAVIAVIPVCRRRMTTGRWMLAVAVVAGVLWIESSLYYWLSDDALWADRLVTWGMLQLPLGLVLGVAVFLWYVLKWLRSGPLCGGWRRR
ncbi:hypothetical protein [Singulisphaera sp. GP187]|uniref:hypothetical protein n=1 Tax=Singulisphaera sp. GP187 TaxID=1882752 RepID=UPI0009413D8C|nr:hypothetical protein [Singulisphaera sp. GP187]